MLNKFMPNSNKTEEKETPIQETEDSNDDADTNYLADVLIRYLPLAERVIGMGERYMQGKAQGMASQRAGTIPTQTGYRVDSEGVKPIVQTAPQQVIEQVPISQEKVEALIEKYIDKLPEKMTLGEIKNHYKSNKDILLPIIMKEING